MGIGPSEQPKDSAQKRCKAGEDEAQVVAGAAQERVDGVADGAFEVVSLEPPVGAGYFSALVEPLRFAEICARRSKGR